MSSNYIINSTSAIIKLPLAILTLTILSTAIAISAPEKETQPHPQTFRAESFTAVYGNSQENIINLSDLNQLQVPIEQRDGIYYALPASATATQSAAPHTLGQTFPSGQFSESALHAIFQSIANYYNTRGIYGVFVVVNSDDIDPQTREDYRPAARKDLRLTIWVSRISEMRTLAKGMRFPPSESVNNPAHRLISKYSPLQPDPNTTRPTSALWKSTLDNYLLDLNRHPARRVDAAISAGTTPGEITLDYLVSERRPWFAYAQISNSASDENDDLRAHVGFSHYQLTNHDDILQLDLAATPQKIDNGFSASASYDRPILYPATLRGRAFASYSEYTAEDLALGLEKFTGYSTATGIDATWSPLRIWGFSLDITPGITWQKFHAYDGNFGESTDADFFAGLLALRLQRNTDTMRSYLKIGYETNINSIPSEDLLGLGRIGARSGYDILNFDAAQSLFIEPLLYGEKFYTGENWRKSARAHEVSLTARGQLSLVDKRLIPQKMMTLGGMYSIRGYPESVVSGDNVWMASLEYRLHIPRLFRPATALPRDRGDRITPTYFGIPINWRAPTLHALPDWDFIVRLFGDIGRANVIDPLSYEQSRTLASIGVGLEAQLLGVLNARVDWGFAQKPVRTANRDITRNSSQVHFSISLLW